MRSTSWGFASRPRDLDLRIGEVPQEERRQGRVSRHPGLALPVDVWANESVVRKQFGALSGLRSFGGVGDRGAGHVFEAGIRGSIRDGNDLHAGNEVCFFQRRIQIESGRHGEGGGDHGQPREEEEESVHGVCRPPSGVFVSAEVAGGSWSIIFAASPCGT